MGSQILSDTGNAFTMLRYALKLCAKFRGTIHFILVRCFHALVMFSYLLGCYLDKREKCNEYNKEKLNEYNDNKKSDNGIKIVSGPFITMHMKKHHGNCTHDVITSYLQDITVNLMLILYQECLA